MLVKELIEKIKDYPDMEILGGFAPIQSVFIMSDFALDNDERIVLYLKDYDDPDIVIDKQL